MKMEAPNQIVNWDERLITIMKQLEGKTIATGYQVNELFELHNDRFLPRETGKSCSGCRTRVWNRLKQYYLLNLKQEDNG